MKTLIAILLLAFAAPSLATTYYVRTDGGAAAQCTGKADAKYPGSGTAQACAWSHPSIPLPLGDSDYGNKMPVALIAAGDTLVIDSGSYMIGYGAPSIGVSCTTNASYECEISDIPSGLDAAHPTTITGVCSSPAELWGTERNGSLFRLANNHDIKIACLNLTDHSNCTENYVPNPVYSCIRNTYPHGPWAAMGIHAQDSNNITLTDLNIHGFATRGVQAGRISDWTVTRVKVVGNGGGGWDGDLGGNNHTSTNSGTLTFTDLTIAWNGCAENYPKLGTYFNCYGQNEGGYGDGFAEAWTGGNFIFIRPVVYKNTQDGLDVLYANGTGTISITHGFFSRNNGNDVKTSGNATITNNVFIAYCSWMKDAGFPAGADACRAGGGEFSDVTGPGQTVTFAYNTMVGNPNGMFGGDPTNADASDVYNVANNIFIGVTSFHQNPDLPFLSWYGDPPNNPATIKMSNNLMWHTREVGLFNCKTPGLICKDPLLTNETMQAFNPIPLPGSPAIGAATGVPPQQPSYGGN